jgi:glycosyltransferase involved in cell wall biosynthesis
VENGSTDGTTEVALSLIGDANVIVQSLPSPDYGAAMREGFLASEGDWVVNFDIDYFSRAFLTELLDQPDDVDLVIGSKRDPRSEDRRPLIRRLATAVDDIAPRVVSTQDLFDTELVVRAERAGYRIVEVPVVVEEIRSAKSSLVKRAPRTLLGLIRMRTILRHQTAVSARPTRR